MLSTTQTIGSSIFILGIGFLVLMACSAFIGAAATKLAPKQRDIQWLLIGLISVWGGVGLTASILGELSFPLFLPFALFPIALGTIITFLPPIRQLIAAIPTHWLIFLQSYRMAGGIFLFPYLTEGVLTRGFALNAGIGDIITGAVALLVGWMVLRNVRYSGVALVLWTLFGVGDLIVAPASAQIYGAGGLNEFPISFIPLFLGPPLGILLHVVTLRSYWLRRTMEQSMAHPEATSATSSALPSSVA